MPGWNEIANQIGATGSVNDLVRRRYLAALAELTQRNVIIYYSAWLQKPNLAPFVGNAFAVSDADKSAFMAVIHGMDRSKGLDLVLHTPGGDTAATESLVQYLHEMFGHDIRAIVPQLAMSAGTMIACACNEILMGAHSSLGPIDPQLGGCAAHAVIEEFERARFEISASPTNIPLWQPIIAKYSPTFIGECEKALKWSHEIVEEWLRDGMFGGQSDAAERAERIAAALGDHEEQRSHGRHISLKKAEEIGLKVVALEREENKDLQDAVLSVHHACIMTFFQQAPVVKMVENQNGVGVLMNLSIQGQGLPPLQPPRAETEHKQHADAEKPRAPQRKKKH